MWNFHMWNWFHIWNFHIWIVPIPHNDFTYENFICEIMCEFSVRAGHVRIACSDLMTTSLPQVVNRLDASSLSRLFIHKLDATKSANIKFHYANILDATWWKTCIKLGRSSICIKSVAFLVVFSKKINQSEWCTRFIQPPQSQFDLNWLVSSAILHSTLIDWYVIFPSISTSAFLWFAFVTTTP